jgi:hypothetical protein
MVQLYINSVFKLLAQSDACLYLAKYLTGVTRRYDRFMFYGTLEREYELLFKNTRL